MCVVAPTFAAELRITRDETSKVTEGLQIYRSLGKSSRFWPRVCVQHLREMALQAYLVVLGRFLIVPVHVPRLPNIYCALRFTPSSALKRLRYYHHLLMCRFFCTLYCSLLLLAYFPLCVAGCHGFTTTTKHSPADNRTPAMQYAACMVIQLACWFKLQIKPALAIMHAALQCHAFSMQHVTSMSV